MGYPPPSPYQQTPYDGRFSFVPPHLIPLSASATQSDTDNEQANMSTTTLPPEMKNFMKSMKNELTTLKQQLTMPQYPPQTQAQYPPQTQQMYGPPHLAPFHPGVNGQAAPPHNQQNVPPFARGGG